MRKRLLPLQHMHVVRGFMMILVIMATSSVAAQNLRSSLPTPQRVFRLTIDIDKSWKLVMKGISSSQFKILSEEPTGYRLVARTKEIPIPVGFGGTKQQRRLVTVDWREVRKQTYSCTLDVQIEEQWQVNNGKWTPARTSDTSDSVIDLIEAIEHELAQFKS